MNYDDSGRTATFTDNGVAWTYAYDADGRLISACRGTTCSGSGFDRLDWLYDGSGHRTQITETSSGGTVTTTDLRYEGDTVVQELTNGAVSRTYATDDAGRIVEVCDPDCASGTTYLVVYNGHGDATGLWKQNTDGTLTLANSYVYSTWGTPTTTVAPGFTDLLYRFLHVGASDVQWDNASDLTNHPGLLYMHARTYSPVTGRFLQPDPSGADSNLYTYGSDSPISTSDPSGAYQCLLAAAGGPESLLGACAIEIVLLGAVGLLVGHTYMRTHERTCGIRGCAIPVAQVRGDPTKVRWSPPIQNPLSRDRWYLKPSPPSKDPFRFRFCLRNPIIRTGCVILIGTVTGGILRLRINEASVPRLFRQRRPYAQ